IRAYKVTGVQTCALPIFAGKRALPLGGVAYAASKFGMAALGIGIGAEEKDSGIRVCNIYPGEVDTPILQFRPTPVTEAHRQSMRSEERRVGKARTSRRSP